MLPIFTDFLPAAARAELDLHLTRRLVALRALVASGAELDGLPGRQPSVLRGIDWVYGVGPAEVAIRASHEIPSPSRAPLPLEGVVPVSASPMP